MRLWWMAAALLAGGCNEPLPGSDRADNAHARDMATADLLVPPDLVEFFGLGGGGNRFLGSGRAGRKQTEQTEKREGSHRQTSS